MGIVYLMDELYDSILAGKDGKKVEVTQLREKFKEKAKDDRANFTVLKKVLTIFCSVQKDDLAKLQAQFAVDGDKFD